MMKQPQAAKAVALGKYNPPHGRHKKRRKVRNWPYFHMWVDHHRQISIVGSIDLTMLSSVALESLAV